LLKVSGFIPTLNYFGISFTIFMVHHEHLYHFWRFGMAGKMKDQEENIEVDNMKALKKKKGKKTPIWWILGIVVLAIVAYVVYSTLQARAKAASTYQTTTIARGTLTATIGATGNVYANQTAILAWQTSGSVQVVNVKVGDMVKAGDVLASLSETSLSQNLILAQADLVTAQQNLDTLMSSSTQKAQAQLNLVTAQKNYDSAKSTLDSYLATNHGGSSDAIANAQAQVTLAEQNLKQAQTMYDQVKTLADTDPTKAQAYTSLYNAQQSLKNAQNNLDYFLLKPSGRDVNQAHANLALAQAKLDDAQREWDRLKNGPDPRDVAAAQARVDAAQATINMARIVAPFGGTISEVDPLIGDLVSPNTTGFRIDDLSHLLVDVQVSEVDINNVSVGQPVAISFDAALGKEYHGQVVAVSQVGTSVQSVVNFKVTVELTDPDAYVKPGMTASVTITVQSLENVLLVPNRAVHLVNGQRVVYVLRNGQLSEIPITLGASDDTSSQVTSGDLSVGDVLVLNPPANFTPGQGGGGRGPFGGG
jgi:HlyD family secretion protein